jgi:hypothetical protein
MKLFSWDWFVSSERKELLALQIKNAKLEGNILEKKLEPKQPEVPKPYKKLIYKDGHLTAVLNGGVVISKKNVDGDVFQQIRNAYTEDIIRMLLSPEPEKAVQSNLYTEEEIDFVESSKNILREFKDFEFKGVDVYLKGVNLPIEPVVLASFIELSERKLKVFDDQTEYELLQEQFEALKYFWMWAALNPIESSRNDLFAFVKKNDIAITKNGMLELYRRVVSVGAKDKELVQFVSEQYFKVKKWKKSPKNYHVYKYEIDEENNEWGYELLDDVDYLRDPLSDYVGVLGDLYISLNTMSENIYTDGHTGTKIIKIGHVYKEDEDKIDLDNTRDCSNGLHVGSKAFGFSGFGDTGVVALVNPMKVRSVPVSDAHKMRVSEMFIVGVVELDQYSEHVDKGDISDYSEVYFNSSLEELEQELKNKSFEKLSCQDNVPALAIADIINIKDALKNRIVNI